MQNSNKRICPRGYAAAWEMAQFCTCDKQIVFFSICKNLLTSTVRNTAELIPSAISYSPFSFGLVKLYSLPGPNILKR